MAQQLETAPSEATEPASPAMPRTFARPAEALPEASLDADAHTGAPASPASLWASESRVHYSITHTDQADARAWIDCDCVIHSD